jgi:hypothetical protein
LDYYGLWNPQSPANYLVNDTSSHLRHISVGCSIKIKDTTSVAYVVGHLHDVIDKVQTGQYPASGFYMQTIFFEQGDLNNMFFHNKVLHVADIANAIVSSGVVEWKTFKQAYTLWDSVYNTQMFQWEGAVSLERKQAVFRKMQLTYFQNRQCAKLKFPRLTFFNRNNNLQHVWKRVVSICYSFSPNNF